MQISQVIGRVPPDMSTKKKPLNLADAKSMHIEQTQQPSTFRTKFSRLSLPHTITQEIPPIEEYPLPDTTQEAVETIIASFNNCPHTPVLGVSVWGSKQYLKRIQLQINREDGDQNIEDSVKHYQMMRGTARASFVQFLDTDQSGSEIPNQMLLQYVISDTLFLQIKQQDTESQNMVLNLCETIGDVLLFSKDKQRFKPALVLLKVGSEDQQAKERWDTFIARLAPWQRFKRIEVLEFPPEESSNELQGEVNLVPRQYSLIKRMIRQHQSPQEQSQKILPCSLFFTFRAKLLNSLAHDIYTHVEEIQKQSKQENLEAFRSKFSGAFTLAYQERTQQLGVLSRLHFYREMVCCKRNMERHHGVEESHTYKRTTKSIIRKQLKALRSALLQQQHVHNTTLKNTLRDKYLQYRPLSLIKCKVMMKELQQEHISDGELDDLFQFLVYLMGTFADELAWGDQLNGLNIKSKRVDNLIENAKSSIQSHTQKLEKLQNNQFARTMNFHIKSEYAKSFKHKLTRKESIQKTTALEALMFQKIKGQKLKMVELKDILDTISESENIHLSIENKETQLSKKSQEIKRLLKQSQGMDEAELKRQKLMEQEQKKREEESDQQGLEGNQPARGRAGSIGRKKKVGGCGCLW